MVGGLLPAEKLEISVARTTREIQQKDLLSKRIIKQKMTLETVAGDVFVVVTEVKTGNEVLVATLAANSQGPVSATIARNTLYTIVADSSDLSTGKQKFTLIGNRGEFQVVQSQSAGKGFFGGKRNYLRLRRNTDIKLKN